MIQQKKMTMIVMIMMATVLLYSTLSFGGSSPVAKWGRVKKKHFATISLPHDSAIPNENFEAWIESENPAIDTRKEKPTLTADGLFLLKAEEELNTLNIVGKATMRLRCIPPGSDDWEYLKAKMVFATHEVWSTEFDYKTDISDGKDTEEPAIWHSENGLFTLKPKMYVSEEREEVVQFELTFNKLASGKSGSGVEDGIGPDDIELTVTEAVEDRA